MTDAGAVLIEEIAKQGPIPFHRFMQVALYHREAGYYRKRRDPFGRQGDYFTAEQLQPVFGTLIGRRARQLWEEMERPEDFTIVELGAGRREMSGTFGEWRYVPVEIETSQWPSRFTGLVFSNEFFDALPVHVAVRRRGEFRQMLVGRGEDRFVWIEGPPVEGEASEYLERYGSEVAEGARVEINLDALHWMDEIARRLERGFVFTIDYGYTARELVAFPQGSLMSYRRHAALEDVLDEPGDRDITAHVCFTALEDRGRLGGLALERFENLSRTLADAGEADGFAQALNASTAAEQLKRRGQLKTLLFDFGEKFRTLIQKKAGGQ